ncbi:VPLPA-CTERM sorting domain-containing protein [Poseidonocella sedimentorum]|uniref:VPLPA-CTERM sorting domain-containing protein n=1 Tax=Poseidonocella sedimentorum TaxID=871652 RepID=UPI0011606305|nr:VPLPA-CTERM sorting domain-containing protein [Poseidonocella sedimentorum]
MVLTTVACLGGTTQAATIDLVVNGDFQSGNVGFNTELTHAPTDLTTAGTYAVTTDPVSVHGSFISIGDHTSSTGNMMAINGTTSSGTISWEQTAAVTMGEEYEFSIWLANLFGTGSTDLDLVVDGSTVASATTVGATSTWSQFSGSWIAPASGNIVLQIIENSVGFGGNDYALDDISFTFDTSGSVIAVPLPASGWLLTVGLAGVFGLGRKRATKLT